MPPIHRLLAGLAGLAAVVILAGCANPKRYNSLDLALLPCERGAPSASFSGESPRFFHALEFDADAGQAFPQQLGTLLARLRGNPEVTDLVFFVHGWNKNPASAESDYQDFLCRFHAHLPLDIADEKRAGGLVVVGIFWPSTLTSADHDPLLVKPASYYRMRDRADLIAAKGLADVFVQLTPILAARHQTRLQLIGHSFGGRMLVRAMETLRGEKLVALLQSARSMDVALLNAAISPASFEWLSDEVAGARKAGTPARFSDDTRSYLFNLHSFHDVANRVLFRLASVLDDDPSACAAGACGVPSFATLCVDDAGQVRLPPGVEARPLFNAWNVDTTRIVFEHSDIYKGRIAALLSSLVFNERQKAALRGTAGTGTEGRCDWLGAAR